MFVETGCVGVLWNAGKMEEKRRNQNPTGMLLFMPLVLRDRAKERRRKLSFELNFTGNVQEKKESTMSSFFH
jgi:hypothetical protein